jgi:hypothetical protein
VGVADVSYYRKTDGLGVELLGGRGSANATAAPLAGVIGDLLGFGGWAAGKARLDRRHEFGDEGLVQFIALQCGTEALPGAQVGIRQALLLCLMKRRWLDQDALALVAFAAARPLNDHCLQRGVFPGAARERGITSRQEVEAIQVGARQAEHAVTLAPQQSAAAQIVTTLAARRGPAHSEDDDFGLVNRLGGRFRDCCEIA